MTILTWFNGNNIEFQCERISELKSVTEMKGVLMVVRLSRSIYQTIQIMEKFCSTLNLV